MAAMNVEKLAVTKIVQMVSMCPHLEPFLDDNDKTLLTDGHIDVHLAKSHSKKNFHGRVVVQVKGRTLTGSPKRPLTYSITKTDLAGYLKTDGVLFFVVFINPRTGNTTPKYVLLNPFKIKQLITAMGSKQQIAVRIKPLPEDPSKIEDIVHLALQSRAEKPDMGIDASQLKYLSRITLYTDGTLNLDAPIRLTRDEFDFTIVYETTGGMTLPVDEELFIMPQEYVGQKTELTVTAGKFSFHNPTIRRADKETVELELSNGLKIHKTDTSPASTGAILLTLRETLTDRYNDLGFYLTCIDSQAFSVNAVENRVQVATDKDQHDLREHFEYLQNLMSLCAILGVDSSLVELEPLEGRRGEQLVDLHGVMIEGGEISAEIHESGRILQPMGRWSLQLLVVQDDAESKWLCRDLFHPELGRQFIMSWKDDAGDSQISRVTPYEVVEREHLPFTLNLHLDNVINAYNEIFDYPHTPIYANATVLNLIRAADTVAIRKDEFLDAASSLNNWLVSKQGHLPHHQINYWQIAARKGPLTQEARLEIRSLKSMASRLEVESPVLMETACAILLGDQEEVAYCLTRLAEEDQIALKDWPIWTLHSSSVTQPIGELSK